MRSNLMKIIPQKTMLKTTILAGRLATTRLCCLVILFSGVADLIWGAPLPIAAPTPTSSPISVPLRALSTNPRYFTGDSGKAIYLTGSHTWNDFQDWGTSGSIRPLDFTVYVKMLVAH